MTWKHELKVKVTSKIQAHYVILKNLQRIYEIKQLTANAQRMNWVSAQFSPLVRMEKWQSLKPGHRAQVKMTQRYGLFIQTVVPKSGEASD
jgi:hypothetical protein